MVSVYISRYSHELDPQKVVLEANSQFLAETHAKRLGLDWKYEVEDGFIALRVIGEAELPMRTYLCVLDVLGMPRCCVDVETRAEKQQLGQAGEAHEVYVLKE